MTTRDEEKAEDRFRMLDAIIQDRIDEGAKLRIAEQQAEIKALAYLVEELERVNTNLHELVTNRKPDAKRYQCVVDETITGGDIAICRAGAHGWISYTSIVELEEDIAAAMEVDSGS